ncbi:MAG: phytoene desaturase family protein [Spirochaetia bacterium]
MREVTKMMDYDVIVIGSGLGGLTAAATLAKFGKKKVLVLEQHFIPGGCATVFERHGVKCEVGLHEMDMGAYKTDMKHVIFKKLGLDKRVPWVELPQTWRLRAGSEEFTIPHGRKAAIEYLISKFPHEEKGIRKYFAAMQEVSYSIRRLPCDLKFWDFFFFPLTTLPLHIKNFVQQATVSQKMNKFIKDNRLKTLLNVNIVYYDDSPDDLSWFYHSCAQNAYYNSARFVKGGSQELSNVLVEIIKENGGDIQLFCEAKKILLEGDVACGVSWEDRKTKEIHQARAKKVIANCAPQVTYEQLLPAEFDDENRKDLKPSVSLYSVYLIFKNKISDLYPGNAYSTFIAHDGGIDASPSEFTKMMRESEVQERPFVFVDYSAIDSGLVKEGDPRSFGVLTSLSYLNEWDDLSIEKYRAKKDFLAQTLFQKLEKVYPGIIEQIEYYEISTPKTIQRYLHCPAGTAYGYKQMKYILGRAPMRAPKVKNLFFASAWGFPGGGFTGAIIGGYHTAMDMIFPMRWLVILRTALCTVVGTALGTAHIWISALFGIAH